MPAAADEAFADDEALGAGVGLVPDDEVLALPVADAAGVLVVTMAACVRLSTTTLCTWPAARSVVSCESGSVCGTFSTEVAPA